MSLAWAPALLSGAAVLVAAGIPTPPRLVDGPGSRPAVVDPRVALVVVGLCLVVLAGPVLAVLSVVGLVALIRRRSRRRASALRREERAGAAEALAVLSSELRAGRPTGPALAAAAQVATAALAEGLTAAAGAGDLGADPVDALVRCAPRSAAPEVLRGLAACWQVCAGTGSSLATAVERLAASARADEAQRLAVATELAGPRATAALLGLLPLAGIALAAGLGAQPLHVLLHTTAGAGCLAAGLGLECLGLWWTGRLVAKAGGEGW